MLGLRLENGDTLVLDPRVPDDWPGYSIAFRTPSGRTLYRIEVVIPAANANRITQLTVNGQTVELECSIARWPMLDDGQEHPVLVTLGA